MDVTPTWHATQADAYRALARALREAAAEADRLAGDGEPRPCWHDRCRRQAVKGSAVCAACGWWAGSQAVGRCSQCDVQPPPDPVEG